MPSDARLNTGLAGHHKTKKLLRRLGPAGPWALVCLFLWTAANRSDGDLSGMSNEDIELAADWQGEPDALVPVLAEVGFLDGSAGERKIHDWAEHNPWAAGAEDRAESSRWAALCKRYGRDGAAERMPDYAVRMRPACKPDAPLPSPIPSPSPKAEPKQERCPEPQADSEPPAIFLPLNTGPEFAITPAKVAEFAELYPAVLIMAELRKMRGWLLNNPTKRKTKGGILRYVNTWLAKEQDKSTTTGTHHATNHRPSAIERVEANVQRARAARGETIDGEAVRILRGDVVEPDDSHLRTPLGLVLRG